MLNKVYAMTSPTTLATNANNHTVTFGVGSKPNHLAITTCTINEFTAGIWLPIPKAAADGTRFLSLDLNLVDLKADSELSDAEFLANLHFSPGNDTLPVLACLLLIFPIPPGMEAPHGLDLTNANAVLALKASIPTTDSTPPHPLTVWIDAMTYAAQHLTGNSFTAASPAQSFTTDIPTTDKGFPTMLGSTSLDPTMLSNTAKTTLFDAMTEHLHRTMLEAAVNITADAPYVANADPTTPATATGHPTASPPKAHPTVTPDSDLPPNQCHDPTGAPMLPTTPTHGTASTTLAQTNIGNIPADQFVQALANLSLQNTQLLLTQLKSTTMSSTEHAHHAYAKQTNWKWSVLFASVEPDPSNPAQLITVPAKLSDDLIRARGTTTPQKALQAVEQMFDVPPPPHSSDVSFIHYTCTLSDLVDRGIATAIHRCHLARSVPKSKRPLESKLSLAFHLAPPNTTLPTYLNHRHETDQDIAAFHAKESDSTPTSRKDLTLCGKHKTVHDLLVTARNIQLFMHASLATYSTAPHKPILHLVLETLLGLLRHPLIHRWALTMGNRYQHFVVDYVIAVESCFQQLYY